MACFRVRMRPSSMNDRKREYMRWDSPGWRSQGSRSGSSRMGGLDAISDPRDAVPVAGGAGVFVVGGAAVGDLGAEVGHEADAFGVAGLARATQGGGCRRGSGWGCFRATGGRP